MIDRAQFRKKDTGLRKTREMKLQIQVVKITQIKPISCNNSERNSERKTQNYNAINRKNSRFICRKIQQFVALALTKCTTIINDSTQMNSQTIVRTYLTRLCFRTLIPQVTTLGLQIINFQPKKVSYSRNTKQLIPTRAIRTTEMIGGRTSRAH